MSDSPLRASRFLVSALLIATAVLYLPALSADFAGVDDRAYLIANPLVRHPDIFTILSPRTLTASDWTPVVTLTHAVEYRLWGLSPMGFHAFNLLLHLWTMYLAYHFLLDCGLREIDAAAAALIVGFHPLQAETVTWISARKDLLAALFGLAFCRAALRGRHLQSLLWLMLALGSKGTAVVFPFWLLIVGIFDSRLRRGRAWFAWAAMFIVLGLLRVALSVAAQSTVIAARPVNQMDFGERMNIMVRVVARQVRQLFLPADLAMNYFWSPQSWLSRDVVVAAALLLAIAILIAERARRDRHVALMALLFVVAILPTANLIAAPIFQADRYLHTALIAAAALLAFAARPLRRVHEYLPFVAVAALCVVWFAPLTRQRIAVWGSPTAVWLDVLQRAPGWAFGWNELAAEYLKRGDETQGESALRKSLAAEAENPDARFNLVLLLNRQKKFAEAEAEARLLLTQHPDHDAAHIELALSLEAQHNYGDAQAQLDQVLATHPENHTARYRRAMLLMHIDKNADAARDLEGLIRAMPNVAAAYVKLAVAKLALGDADGALSTARQATEIDPNSSEAWQVLARCYSALGDRSAANQALERAQELSERNSVQSAP